VPRIVVLDAMGVMYRAADDVAELLIPFVVAHSGIRDPRRIGELYREASLGNSTADRFWRSVGLRPALEDAYLDRHALNPGLLDTLNVLRECGVPTWGFSNDVARWSRKLRERFDLERYFSGFVVSSDIRARKPDPAAYVALLARVGCEPGDLLFVDDREANIVAASEHGIDARLFAGFDALTDWIRHAGHD
jgi:putative hydrolase of the HAD superfamily